jgi:segregation and condensation protein A
MTDLAVAPETHGTTGSEEAAASVGFAVHLANFEGPFDLLLSLISKHKMDVTEVALSQVTDEFIAYIKAAGDGSVGSEASGPGEKAPWDLEQTTSFLVVASTLLDLKAARLLPQGDVEDEEDLALLEARDLLFARLLQYKAFKQVAAILDMRIAGEARRHPRSVGLEERFASLLPEVLIGLGLEEFASLAARALEPKPEPEAIGLSHIHAPAVSVREQGFIVMGRLKGSGTMTFRALAADAPDMMTRVARFLALLELFREGVVSFDQMTPLGDLSVRWIGSEDTEVEINDEFDGAPPEDTSTTESADDGETEERE